ncbi:MAG: VWA domain-containing protein [Lachnospiraceae bacterium]|nr:VWA domain-containing protein [Lachnospiraceae bacterium]
MIINPIIPIWAMAIICVLFLVMKRKGTFDFIRQIIIVVLLFVINLRFTIPGTDHIEGAVDVDVLFVCDNTISMIAEDYNGDGKRLDAVKKDCEYIIDQFPGASFSVVSFDNKVDLRTPYTSDVTITKQTIGILNGQGQLYARGTTLNDIMGEMEKLLDKERETYQIVFFITDGEDTSEQTLKSYSGLDKYVDGGAVLGYGTKEGGPMRPVYYAGDTDEPEYLYYYDDDFNRLKAISKLDEDNLKSIADDLGVEYVHMTKQSNIDDTIKGIQDEIGPMEMNNDIVMPQGDKEFYYIFIIPLVVLLIIDFIYYRRKIFRKA